MNNSIDISTSQNVTIQYDLALLRDRFFAFLIDSVILWITYMLLSMLGWAFDDSDLRVYWNYLIVACFIFFYTLVSEILMDGQTLGKKALGIRVIRMDGREMALGDYVTRWAFRFLDIYVSLGGIGAIAVSLTDYNQRLGDFFAGTAVVKLKSTVNVGLADVLRIQSRKDYKITYPEARYLEEDELMLAKNVLDRVKKYPNEAHVVALNTLASVFAGKLQLKTVPANKAVFLKTVISDYVVLTR